MTEEATKNDHLNADVIRAELQRLLPDNIGRENTLDAFRRFANKAPWIPFRNPRSTTSPSAVDKAESALFDELLEEGKYLRDCKVSSSAKHYHQFAKRWNESVAQRFTNWCTGDDVVVQINYKSTR